MAYPEVFPVSEVKSLISYLRGAAGDPKATLHDAYVVEGYALGRVHDGKVAHSSPAATKGEQAAALETLSRSLGVSVGTPLPPPTTKEEQAAALESLTHAMAGVWQPPAWLLPLVLQIIQEVLAAIGPKP